MKVLLIQELVLLTPNSTYLLASLLNIQRGRVPLTTGHRPYCFGCLEILVIVACNCTWDLLFIFSIYPLSGLMLYFEHVRSNDM